MAVGETYCFALFQGISGCRRRPLAAIANLVIYCHKRDLALVLELAAVDDAMSSGRPTPSEKPSVTPSAGSRPPASGAAEKRALGIERIRLDLRTVKIELAAKLFELRPLMIFAGGIAGLADRHTQGGGVQRDLGDE